MSFKRTSSILADGDVLVDHYVSSESGLQVFLASADGPIVEGYICLATEAHDDDGLPHTLEHLIFLGSEDYPYKGVLDLLANKNLAYGTNAWTDTDHTCYTLKTAGDEGFLNLLPIYLDHVLYPTLTDSGFLTEVHHIDGEGKDSGTVYCEMQATVNTGEDRSQRELLRQMYPGKCGYKSETGGMLKNLRESTSNAKVRDYHSQFYRSENAAIIIVGQVNIENLFECLERFEAKIIRKNKDNPREQLRRPWQDAVPPLECTKKSRVAFPTDEDTHGLLQIGWRGPSAVTDFSTLICISMLTEYLTDTAAAPLQKEFVERADPFCSSISFYYIENSESCLILDFTGVPVEKLILIEGKLFELLKQTVEGKEPFDEARMKSIIRRQRRQILSSLESSPASFVSGAAIGYFLYGNNEEDLRVRLQTIPLMEKLSTEKPEFWLNLLKKFFVDAPYVLVIGEPSPSLMAEMEEEERRRIEEQCALLGEAGLKQKEVERAEAETRNNVKPPPEMLAGFEGPTVENLSFHEIRRFCNHEQRLSESIEETAICDLPLRFQLDDVRTNFITLRIISNTQCLTPGQRLYLPIWSQIVSESAIKRGDELVPYEEIVTQLADDTVYSFATIGMSSSCIFLCGEFAQLVGLFIKVEQDKYEKAVLWVYELLYQTEFTVDRMKVVATRMLNDISSFKREGHSITSALQKSLYFTSSSNHWSVNVFRQQKFLSQLLKELESSPSQVILDMENLRKQLCCVQNLMVHLTCDFRRFENKGLIGQAWFRNFVKSTEISRPISSELNIVNCFELLVTDDTTPHGAIVGVGTVESAYLVQSVESFCSHTHPDMAPLLVALEYFVQCEGPFYNEIRGKGLAYGVFMYPRISEGLLSFELFQSVNLFGAYKAALDVVRLHLDDDNSWNQEMLKCCKGSLLFQMVEKEASASDASYVSLLCYLRQMKFEERKELIPRIWTSTIEDVKRVTAQYIKPLFDASASRCAICCHPSKVDELVTAFKGMERQLDVIQLDRKNIMSTLKPLEIN